MEKDTIINVGVKETLINISEEAKRSIFLKSSELKLIIIKEQKPVNYRLLLFFKLLWKQYRRKYIFI